MIENTKTINKRKPLKPSELRKILHPEEEVKFRYTEELSYKEEKQKFTESEIEFLLERLPEKNAHHEFERLAVCLCEAEVCRNIKPATGPVGGGDYGEDASTYKVSDDIKDSYFWIGVGSPNIGNNWLFAFSIQKNWKKKILEDAGKASKRIPIPNRFIFVSSQPIKIKNREDKKKELCEKFGFEVEILDRSWIVHQIVYKGHLDLAFKFLDAPQSFKRKEGFCHVSQNEQIAPISPEIKKRIEELKGKVTYRTNYLYINHRAEDLLELADIVKEIDKACAERAFHEAIQDARESGIKYLLHRAIYNYFWISFWYWDDVSKVLPYLDDFYSLIKELNIPEPLEKGFNIWTILYGAINNGLVNENNVKLDIRRKFLLETSNKIISDKDRPTSSLMVREMLIQHKAFYEYASNHAVSDEIVAEFKAIIKKTLHIPLFPLRRLSERLIKLPELIESNFRFEELLDYLQTVIGKKEGDLAEAEFAFEKAMIYFEQKNYRKALKELTKSKFKGISQETLYETIQNLIATGDCYIELGFSLAAKNELLMAYHLSGLYQDKPLKSQALLSLRALNNIELQRGRLRLALWWLQLHEMLCHLWRADEQMLGPHGIKFDGEVDSSLACVLVWAFKSDKAIFNDIYPIVKKLQLPLSCIFAESLLGGIEAGKKCAKELNWDDEWCKLSDMVEKSVSSNFNFKVEENICNEDNMYICENFEIVGVKFTLKTQNDYFCNLLAESLGAAIQAFFVNGRLENLAIIEDEVELEFKIDTWDWEEIQTENVVDSKCIRKIYKINQKSFNKLLPETGKEGIYWIRLQLLCLLLEICIDPLEDLKKELDWMYKEGAFQRALGMGPLFLYLEDHCKKEVYDGTIWKSTAP